MGCQRRLRDHSERNEGLAVSVSKVRKVCCGYRDICVCKTKVDQERCVLNPRNTLRELFQQRCRGISASELLGEFAETVSSIALANDRDLNWVGDQIRSLLPSLKRTCRKWVIGICPLPFAHTGLLPAWLKDEREIIPDSDLQQSLSVGKSEAELANFEAEIGQSFEEAVKAALDRADLRMAGVVCFDPKHVSMRMPRPGFITAMVATVKRDNPDRSIEQICQILDMKRCPLRDIDKRAGKPHSRNGG